MGRPVGTVKRLRPSPRRALAGADIGCRAGGRMQPLLRDRPVPVQIISAIVLPAAFGALCGWLLGINKTAYLVLSLLGILGGYAAGAEHNGAGAGAIRGLIGGSLFGGLILLVNDALDKAPKADLPDPKIWLLAITAGLGVILGAMGGRARANYKEEEKKRDEVPFDIRRVQRSEVIGFIGAGILLLSLFLNWFATSCATQAAAAAARTNGCNPNSQLHDQYGSFTAF